MRQHVPILGWCFIVYHAIIALVGIGIGVIVSGAGALSGERDAMFITGGIGIFIAALLLVLSLPGIVTGFGLLKFRPWARILAIILGVLHLLSFPFGTALGVYTLVVLTNAEAPMLFGQQPSAAVLRS